MSNFLSDDDDVAIDVLRAVIFFSNDRPFLATTVTIKLNHSTAKIPLSPTV